MFSKNHNLHFSNTMTNMNPTKNPKDPKTRPKHPKQELHTKKKQQKLRKYHKNHPKLTWSSAKPTIHTHLLYEKRELNKTQRRPQNMSKTPQTRTGSLRNMKENPKSHRSTPKVPVNLPDVLQNPQFTIFHHGDQHELN